jgi:hypothetical protein
MSGNVFANGRSIVHKDDGDMQIAAVPDVCKTPSPAGPVPIPYPNMAQNSDLADGTKKVKIQGAMVAHKSANISKSSGDEPGTVGGVVSNVNRGKMMFALYSMDVKVEGKNAVRFADLGPGNGNSYNDFYPTLKGKPDKVAYGDDAKKEICDKCHKPRPEHRLWAYPEAIAACKRFMEKVEELAKDVIDARFAWSTEMVKLTGDAVFRVGGFSKKFIEIESKNVLVTYPPDNAPKDKIHKDDADRLWPLISAIKDLHSGASTVLAEVKPYKDASTYLPDSNRMFGIVICKCREKDNVVPNAYCAISGKGTDETTIVEKFTYSDFDKILKQVAPDANSLDVYVNTGKYCRPLIPKLRDGSGRKDGVPNEAEATALERLMNDYAEIANQARAAVNLTNSDAKHAPGSPDHYFAQLTLAQIAKKAIELLNGEQNKLYNWKLPPTPNLGPPTVPGVTTAPNGNVRWPAANYRWSKKKNKGPAPFTCAAPKALKFCEDDGHQAWSLCEIVYCGLNPKPVTTAPRKYRGKTKKGMGDSKNYSVGKRKHEHKEIANHCDTCKELIPKMRCDKKGKDCP